MNKQIFFVIACLAIAVSVTAVAERDNHEHHASPDKHNESEKPKEAEHGHEENAAVGPDKGILEASDSRGFKLSPEATKNFELKMISVTPGAALTLPKQAIYFGQQEKNLYRLRDGFFRRIDFDVVSKTAASFVVRSSDFQAGDQVVVEGIGYLRIAELAAFGGVADEH